MALPQVTSNVVDISEKINSNTDDKLAAIANINSNILKSVSNIEKTFDGYIKWKKLQADLADDPKSKKQIFQKQKSENFSGIKSMPGISGISLLGLTGLVASLTGLDDWLKTLDLPRIFQNIKGAFKALNTFGAKIGELAFRLVNWVSKFKLPELPKIRLVDFEGKPLKFEDLLEKFKIKLPELPKFNFIDKAGELVEKFKVKLPELPKFDFTDKAGELVEKFKVKLPEFPKFSFIDEVGELVEKFKVKLPEFPKFSFIDEAGQVVENLLEKFKIKLPDLQPIRSAIAGAMLQFELFSKNLQEAVKSFPRIQIEFPEWMKNFKMPDFSGIKSFFVGTEEGGGIIGKIADFFSGFKIPEALTKYLLTPLKFLIGPVLTFFDFIFGFFEGWKEVSEKDMKATFGEKLWGGLVGGVEGIIKGILGAIDLLAGKVLPWLLEKMGLNDAAGFLKKVFDEEKGGGLSQYVDFSAWGEKLGQALFNVFNVMIPDAIKSVTAMIKNAKQWLVDKLGLGNIFGEDIKGIDFSKIFDKFKFNISIPEIKFPDISATIKEYGKKLAQKLGNLLKGVFNSIASIFARIGDKLPDWAGGDRMRDAASTIRSLGSRLSSNIERAAQSISVSSPRMSSTARSAASFSSAGAVPGAVPQGGGRGGDTYNTLIGGSTTNVQQTTVQGASADKTDAAKNG